MRSKINAIFDASKFSHISFSDKELHVVDYTQRTASARAVEVHNTKPTDIDSLIVQNPIGIDLSTSIFTSHCFKDPITGYEPKQCECVMSPTTFTSDSWVLFIEIKDCKPKNVSTYHQEVKDKIIENVQLFRDKGILAINKVVYAVVSFPRKEKTNYHNHLIKATECKRFKDDYKIIIKGTNEISIKNHKRIS